MLLMITPQVPCVVSGSTVQLTEQVQVVATTTEPIKIKTKYTKEDIRDIVASSSVKYKYKTDDVMKLIACETGDTFDTNIQSSSIQSYGREKSFGLAQIHIPAHPDITVSQAKDPYFAIDFIGKNWNDRRDIWVTCTKKLKI